MNTLDLDKIDLGAEAPVQEPERQYYFMAKLRALVKEKSRCCRERTMRGS